jgi:hypothetical protein
MRRRRARFLQRLAAIEAQVPARRRWAECRIRAYYRMYRDLPPGAAAYLNTRRRYREAIFFGELEHRLGLASILFRLAALRSRPSRAWARLRLRRRSS